MRAFFILGLILCGGLFSFVPHSVKGGALSIGLFGHGGFGWGFTATSISSPGPDISIFAGEHIGLSLVSVDGAPEGHNFGVDYDGNGQPDILSPIFTGTELFQFNATSTPGSYVYRCYLHPSTMWGHFNVLQKGATSLSVSPAVTQASVGQRFRIAVNASSVQDLYWYKVDLRFSPTLLQGMNINFSGTWLDDPLRGRPFAASNWTTIDNANGEVRVEVLIQGTFPGVTGSGTLFYVYFTSTAPGTSPIHFDGSQTSLIDSQFRDMTHSNIDGSVVVNPSPLVVTAYCSGAATANQPVTCTSSATGGRAPYAFFWNAPNGTPPAGTGPSFTTIFPTQGDFPVSVTATDAVSINATAVVIVKVAAPLQVSMSADLLSGPAPLYVTFAISVSGGSLPYRTEWSFGDGESLSGFVLGPPHLYVNPGAFVAEVRVTDNQGRRAQASETITVLPGTGNLTITVRDSRGNLLSGAIVWITSAPVGQDLPTSLSTGLDGSATFENLLPGNYAYQVLLNGFEIQSNTTRVVAGQTSSGEVSLSPILNAPASPTPYLLYAGITVGVLVLVGILVYRRRRRNAA